MSGAALRIKMSVGSVKRLADAGGNITAEEIAMQAVYGPEGSANRAWSQWTPAGQLSFTVNNPAAFGKVLPGQFFFLDLVPTTKEEEPAA